MSDSRHSYSASGTRGPAPYTRNFPSGVQSAPPAAPLPRRPLAGRAAVRRDDEQVLYGVGGEALAVLPVVELLHHPRRLGPRRAARSQGGPLSFRTGPATRG